MGRRDWIPAMCIVLLLVQISLQQCESKQYIKYKDAKQPVGARIKDLLKRMSVKEKIGQMVQIDLLVASPAVLKKYMIGSVLSGGGSVPSAKASVEEWVNTVNGLQKGALSTRLGIPMIYGIDAVHGHNNVYNATIFPHNVGLGVTRDPVLIKRIGEATAKEVRATGISYVFAPCIAVCRDPRWGRCFESYSEDPSIVQMMTEIIPGLQGDIPSHSRKGVPFVATGGSKVAACAKHYLGLNMEVQALNPAKLPPSPPPPETNNNPFGNSDMVGQKGRRKRRRRNICLVSTAATIILVVLVMLILALTVFKAKKPVTNMDNITLSDLSVSLDMANRLALRVNLTLDVDMTVNNPNKVGVSLSDGNSASLIYRGEQVGEIPMPAGKISADSTTGMNMTLTLMADRLISRSQLYADVVADVLPLNVYAKIKAKVSIFKVIKIRVTAVTTCDITVFVSNRTVGQQNCNSKTKF